MAEMKFAILFSNNSS